MNIFLIAKTKFRNASLNNFKSQKKFGQFKLYNFIGPYLYYIGKLLVNLKVGKAISFDGRPILKKKRVLIYGWEELFLKFHQNIKI